MQGWYKGEESKVSVSLSVPMLTNPQKIDYYIFGHPSHEKFDSFAQLAPHRLHPAGTAIENVSLQGLLEASTSCKSSSIKAPRQPTPSSMPVPRTASETPATRSAVINLAMMGDEKLLLTAPNEDAEMADASFSEQDVEMVDATFSDQNTEMAKIQDFGDVRDIEGISQGLNHWFTYWFLISDLQTLGNPKAPRSSLFVLRGSYLNWMNPARRSRSALESWSQKQRTSQRVCCSLLLHPIIPSY